MVPDKDLIIKITSLHRTILNIIENFVNLSLEKKENILKGNWSNLYDISLKQNEMKNLLDNFQKELEQLQAKYKYTDFQIEQLKKETREKINQFREIEEINVKMLKDAYFVTKLKLKEFFNVPVEKEIYNKSGEKETIIKNDSLVMNWVV